MKRRLINLAALVAGLFLPTAAFAQALDESELVTPVGMAFTVGGAYSNFTDNEARDFTQPGGGWEARYVIGTRTVLGAEAAYTASANPVDALGVDDGAVLLGNGAEASVRANLTTDTAAQPFVLAGLGWRHYNIVNTDTNTSDIADADDAMTIPLTAGVAYRYDRFLGDIRAMYRPSLFDDIIAGDREASLDSASVNLNVGFEF
jgi:hypothetical protein